MVVGVGDCFGVFDGVTVVLGDVVTVGVGVKVKVTVTLGVTEGVGVLVFVTVTVGVTVLDGGANLTII